MIIDWNKINIMIRPGSVDFRKQIDGLVLLVEKDFKISVFSNCLFVFCSNDRKKIKVLYWDKNGFCLWQKRLEKDKFPWPKNQEDAKEITFSEFKMLLEGIDFFKAHKKLNYEKVI